ncbi:MAG: hypothetical protein PVG53_13630 [Holophagae bacterium]|jgi:hypothetical protein
MIRRIAIGTALLAVLATGTADAGFGASDLIYIPVVTRAVGSVGSQWISDVYVTNVDDVDIDVAFIYLPSGFSNAGRFVDRASWLGGRESDGFGHIDEQLASIPPGGTVVLRDIVGEYWSGSIGANGNGSLVAAAYEADTLEDDGTRVYRNAVVNSRIYNDTTIWVEDDENPGEFVERAAEYGQNMPGVPWYNLADGGAVGDDYDLSYEVLTGGEEGSGRRYNVGVFNASDLLTTLTIQIQPFQANGEPYLDADELEISTIVTVPPASHVQLFRPYPNEWGIEGDVDQSTVRVSIVAWSSSAANPRPMMTSYGSVVYNRTNDPSSVLPSFADPYDVECIWGSGDPGAAKRSRPAERPVAIPPR